MFVYAHSFSIFHHLNPQPETNMFLRYLTLTVLVDNKNVLDQKSPHKRTVHTPIHKQAVRHARTHARIDTCMDNSMLKMCKASIFDYTTHIQTHHLCAREIEMTMVMRKKSPYYFQIGSYPIEYLSAIDALSMVKMTIRGLKRKKPTEKEKDINAVSIERKPKPNRPNFI